MSEFEIRTRTFGRGGLLPVRSVTTNNKTVTTPVRPTPAAKLRANESFDDDAQEAVELYAQASTSLLRQARRDPDTSLVERLGAHRVPDDAMRYSFVSYQDGHAITEAEAVQIADAITTTGDFATLPLVPELVDAVDPEEGIQDAAYQSLRTSQERILQAFNDQPEDLPIMGVLPKLGWAYLENLLDLYEEHGVKTFCLNFGRRRITAARQVGIMRPLARHFVSRGLEEDILLYAINMDPKDREILSGVHPAANMAALGLGIDIVGGTHVPPPGPGYIFEPDEEESDEDVPITFRLFVKDDWTFEEVPLSELPSIWPVDSGISIDRAMERARASPAAKSRIQSLVNAEQQAKAAKELQSQLLDGDVVSYLEAKPGVTEEIIEAFQTVRASFDDEREQSGLSDFMG